MFIEQPRFDRKILSEIGGSTIDKEMPVSSWSKLKISKNKYK